VAASETGGATVLRVPASAFSTDGGTAISVQFNPLNGYWVKSAVGGAGLHATVDLPDGATITRVTSLFYDIDVSGDLEANLRRKSWATGTGMSDLIGATGSSGASAADQTDDAPILTNVTVDTASYFYFIQVGFSSTAGERRFYAMEIEYTDPATSAGVSEEEEHRSRLAASHPNPFRSRTSVRFPLDTTSDVRVDIYDAAGRRVRSIARSSLPAGTHEIEWDGRSDSGVATPAGVYFAQVSGGAGALAAKLVRLR